jgi:hypothetical protein
MSWNLSLQLNNLYAAVRALQQTAISNPVAATFRINAATATTNFGIEDCNFITAGRTSTTLILSNYAGTPTLTLNADNTSTFSGRTTFTNGLITGAATDVSTSRITDYFGSGITIAPTNDSFFTINNQLNPLGQPVSFKFQTGFPTLRDRVRIDAAGLEVIQVGGIGGTLTAVNVNGKLNVVGGTTSSGNVLFCNNTTSTTGNFDVLTDSNQHFRFSGGTGAGSNVLSVGGATNGGITIPSTNGLITVPTIKNGTSDFTIGNAENIAGGFVNVGLMNHGTIPYPNVGINSNNLSIGWNKSSGDAEVDFYNSANSGFNFYGRNTSTSIYQIARLRGDNVTTYALSFGSDAYAYLGAGSYGTSIGVRVGNGSMSGNNNTLVGYNTGFTLTNGYSNTFIGSQAGRLATQAYQNTCLGAFTGENISIGFVNVLLGYYSGNAITSGAGNVCVGPSAGLNIDTAYNNVCIGNGAGTGITNGGSGIYIGVNALASGGAVNNETVIGTGTGKGANSCFVTTGNNYQGNNLTLWTVTSDSRIKTNIAPLESSLSKILALEPVSYEHKEDIHNNLVKKRCGYIAQDYEKIFPEHCGTYAPNKFEREELGLEEVKSICPDFIPHLVKAIQEQQEKIVSLEAQLASLKAVVDALVAQKDLLVV